MMGEISENGTKVLNEINEFTRKVTGSGRAFAEMGRTGSRVLDGYV